MLNGGSGGGGGAAVGSSSSATRSAGLGIGLAVFALVVLALLCLYVRARRRNAVKSPLAASATGGRMMGGGGGGGGWFAGGGGLRGALPRPTAFSTGNPSPFAGVASSGYRGSVAGAPFHYAHGGGVGGSVGGSVGGGGAAAAAAAAALPGAHVGGVGRVGNSDSSSAPPSADADAGAALASSAAAAAAASDAEAGAGAGAGAAGPPGEEAQEEGEETNWAVASFDYAAAQGDELTLAAEARVWASARGLDGGSDWHRGYVCERRGQSAGGGWRTRGSEGVFPAAYVRFLRAREAEREGLPLGGPKDPGRAQRLVRKAVEVEVWEDVVAVGAGAEEEEAPLPEGWVRRGLQKSSRSLTTGAGGKGKVWYEHLATGKTQITRPKA